MEMPELLARKLHRNFSLRPQQGLGLSAAVPPVIPVPWLAAWRQGSSMVCSEQIWVQCTSVAEITQLLEGGSSLPVPCHPSSHVQSHVSHILSDFVLSDCPFFPPALFSILQQLWLCVFGFTIQQKRALYQLSS